MRMSSIHVMCIGSHARANVIASLTIQPGPQSSARPTSSPSTFFIASTQAIDVLEAAFGHEAAVRVRCSCPRLVVPHVGHGAHHRGIVEADGHLDEGEAFFGFLHLLHVLGVVLRHLAVHGGRKPPL